MTFVDAPIPANEAERLQALARLNILDTPIEERFDRITRMVCTTLDVPMSAFSLIDETRQWQKSMQGLAGYVLERNQSFCAHVMPENGILVVDDAHKDPRFKAHPFVDTEGGVAFYAGYPVRSPDGYTVGTLCAIDTKPRQLTDAQRQMLADLAAMIETELKVSQMVSTQAKLQTEIESAKRLAMIDPLTHLWNRAGMTELLSREWSKAQREGTPLTIVIADIDHFKKVNDTYGHPAGDAVLQSLSRRMLSVLRNEDIVGRMGGEEFMLILPNCQPDQVLQVLERVRNLAAALPVNTTVGEIAFTISFGAMTAHPHEKHEIEHIIQKADAALYKAKANGRNRIEIAA